MFWHKNQDEGNGFRSLLYLPMRNEAQIQAISRIAAALLESDPAYFLVEVKISPGNDIKLFVDGEDGITIDKCVSLNRALHKQLEEKEMFPNNDFSLEVSSPGLGEPLKLFRQYQKNLGRNVEVVLVDGTKWEGNWWQLMTLRLWLRKPEVKKEPVKRILLFQNIKTTKIQVVF